METTSDSLGLAASILSSLARCCSRSPVSRAAPSSVSSSGTTSTVLQAVCCRHAMMSPYLCRYIYMYYISTYLRIYDPYRWSPK